MRRAPLAPLNLAAYSQEEVDPWELAQQLGRAQGMKRAQDAQIEKAANNPYARSFRLFLKDCIWTIDEARGGEVRPWPWDGEWERYWIDWEFALLTCSPLLIDKTRRTMASNVVTAFDLWIAAGGIDPRWPALQLSRSNRRVLIQAQKLEGVGGSAEFVDRIRRILQVSNEKAGVEARWPGFPTFTFKFGVALGTNGSQINAVPQGAEQVRGPGTTLLHAEELAFWEQAKPSMENALPALHPFGHLVAVTTPAVSSYAADIRYGRLGGDR